MSTGLQQPGFDSRPLHILPPDCGGDLASLGLSFVVCEMSTTNPYAGLWCGLNETIQRSRLEHKASKGAVGNFLPVTV